MNLRNILIGLVIIAVSFFAGMVTQCSSSHDVKQVVVPVTTPASKIDIPIVIAPKANPKTGKEAITQNEKGDIFTEDARSQQLASKLNEIKDCKSRVDYLLRQAEVRVTEINFENDKAKSHATITSRGEILDYKGEIELKPQTFNVPVTIPEKEVEKKKIHLFMGAGVSNTVKLDNFSRYGNIAVQFKNQDIIEASYDTRGNIGIGYKKRIF